MATTTDGIVYPVSGDHTRLWEHFMNLADSVQALWSMRGRSIVVKTVPATDTTYSGGAIGTIACPVIAGRRYRLSANFSANKTVDTTFGVLATPGAGYGAITRWLHYQHVASGSPCLGSGFYIFTASATGTVTFTIDLALGSGSITATANSVILDFEQLG